MTTPTMIITARRPALLAGHDNELDVLVRVQGALPDLLHQCRVSALALKRILGTSMSLDLHACGPM